MSKVAENKLNKRNRMLDAALQLFTTQGLSRTSVSDITGKSGVAKGTFYLYFTDKYDIRNKLVAYESSKLLKSSLERMRVQPFTRLDDKIIFVAEQILSDLEKSPELLRLISKNLSWAVLKREITQPNLEDFDIHEVFAAITREYGISHRESEMLLYLIVELVGSTCYSALLYQDPCSMEELKPRLFDMIRFLVDRAMQSGEEVPQNPGLTETPAAVT